MLADRTSAPTSSGTIRDYRMRQAGGLSARNASILPSLEGDCRLHGANSEMRDGGVQASTWALLEWRDRHPARRRCSPGRILRIARSLLTPPSRAVSGQRVDRRFVRRANLISGTSRQSCAPKAIFPFLRQHQRRFADRFARFLAARREGHPAISSGDPRHRDDVASSSDAPVSKGHPQNSIASI